jgi:hypothetical protein
MSTQTVKSVGFSWERRQGGITAVFLLAIFVLIGSLGFAVEIGPPRVLMEEKQEDTGLHVSYEWVRQTIVSPLEVEQMVPSDARPNTRPQLFRGEVLKTMGLRIDETDPRINSLQSTRLALDPIAADRPIFVLSLPHSGNMALHRYFQCSGVTSDRLGRIWSNEKDLKIGQCMSRNVENGDPILQDCGNYQIWMEIDHFSKMGGSQRECFLPALKPGILAELLTTYPNATVINAIKDPMEWYTSLSSQFKRDWPTACTQNHDHGNNDFPANSSEQQQWVDFYQQYHKFLRTAVMQHPAATFLEIDLSSKEPQRSGQELEQHLAIPSSCWTQAAMDPTLPKDITYPIFVASLPKSATTTSYKYLNCGLGDDEGRHYEIENDPNRHRTLVASCFYNNVQNNRSITENCGDYLHWSDIGAIYHLDHRRHCYYPTLEGGLEEIYKAHPYATIFLTTRDPVRWYESALNYYNTLSLWTQFCTGSGFPSNASDVSAWVDFYHNHTNLVRAFARSHPTMNYVEVKLEEEEELLTTLQDHFGFSDTCWGHSNVQRKRIYSN